MTSLIHCMNYVNIYKIFIRSVKPPMHRSDNFLDIILEQSSSSQENRDGRMQISVCTRCLSLIAGKRGCCSFSLCYIQPSQFL